jgi:hypothetical protein
MYWLCFSGPDGVCVVLQPASSLIHARMLASLAGLQPGEFQEGHWLEAKLVKRIPKTTIGRCLSATEAKRLLGLLDRSDRSRA